MGFSRVYLLGKKGLFPQNARIVPAEGIMVNAAITITGTATAVLSFFSGISQTEENPKYHTGIDQSRKTPFKSRSRTGAGVPIKLTSQVSTA